MNLYLHRIHRCGILLIFHLFLGSELENYFLLCLYTMIRDEQFFLSFSISPMTNQTSQSSLPRLVAAPQPCGSKTGACSAATTLTVDCSLARGPWPSLEPQSTSWCLHPNWRLQQKALLGCESWSCRLSPSWTRGLIEWNPWTGRKRNTKTQTALPTESWSPAAAPRISLCAVLCLNVHWCKMAHLPVVHASSTNLYGPSGAPWPLISTHKQMRLLWMSFQPFFVSLFFLLPCVSNGRLLCVFFLGGGKGRGDSLTTRSQPCQSGWPWATACMLPAPWVGISNQNQGLPQILVAAGPHSASMRAEHQLARHCAGQELQTIMHDLSTVLTGRATHAPLVLCVHSHGQPRASCLSDKNEIIYPEARRATEEGTLGRI